MIDLDGSPSPSLERPRVGLVYLGRRGGGAVYALEIARALARKCPVVCVISKQVDNLSAWRANGLCTLEVSTPATIASLPWTTTRFLAERRFWAEFGQADLDVLYYPMLHVWAPLINAWFRRLPVVSTIHDAVAHRGEESLLADLLRRTCLRQSTRVIVLSQHAARDLAAARVDASRVHVVPLGVFTWYAAQELGSLDLRGGEGPILLWFGRVAEYKGIDCLLTAFARVRQSLPEARLIVAGEGDLSPYLTDAAHPPGVLVLNRWIRDEEVADLFSAADMVLLPYVDASQSGVVSIAAAFGVPVVASRVGALSEQVVDGETGLLVERGNAEAFAEACLRLARDPYLRQRLGEEAQSRARSTLAWETVADSVFSVCREACGPF